MERAAEVRADDIESALSACFDLLDGWFGLHDIATKLNDVHVEFRSWRKEQG